MGVLLRLGVKRSLQAAGVVLCLGMLAGSIRLLPWLWAPDVPIRLCIPFARELGIRAAEVALLIGVPLGTALATASFVERGEARALFALGASPFGLASRLLALLAVSAGLLVAVAAAPRASPGRLVQALLAEGRASCARSAGRGVTVPLAAVTWLCPKEGDPRVVGRVPRLSGNWWFSASHIAPNDDLSELRLGDLRVSFPFDRPRGELSVERAVVRGLPQWGRPSGLPALMRALLLGIGLAATGATAVLCVLRAPHPRPWVAAFLALAGSLSVLLVARVAEQGAAALGLLSAPSAAAVVIGLSFGIRRLYSGVRA